MRTIRAGLGAAITSVVACTVFATVAFGAGAGTEEFKARVSYQDLDIHNPVGAKVLYDRIKDVSASSCEVDSYYVTRSLTRFRHAKQCYHDLVDRFVARIDSAELQKLHRS